MFWFTLRCMKLTVTVTHVCVLLFVVEVWAGYVSEAGRVLFRKQRKCFCCCSHISWKDCGGWVCHRIGQQTHDEVFIRNSHVHRLVFHRSLESDLRSSPSEGSRASLPNSGWQVEPAGLISSVYWPLRSDKGLTLETSAFESLYGGQFTLSTQLINQFILTSCTCNTPHGRSTTVSLETYPLHSTV